MTARIEEVWGEFGDPLGRFIARRVANEHDAEDVLQDVFVKAYTALDKIEDSNKMRPWLYRIASNTIADYYRGRIVAPRYAPEPQETLNELIVGPENVKEEVLACLGPAIEGLPEAYRRALMLADLEGLTHKEVAEELGLSLSGAKSRVQRARRKLRATFLSWCWLEVDRVGNVIDCRDKDKA